MIHLRGHERVLIYPQAQLPEAMLEPAPRFGPAAKAARAKEREEEAARLAKEKKAAAAAKPAAKPQCALVCTQHVLSAPIRNQPCRRVCMA